LLLILLLQYKSLPKWADDLRTHPHLAQIAGFAPFQTPAVGTFYTFMTGSKMAPIRRPAPTVFA
jgi:hypothetical protein